MPSSRSCRKRDRSTNDYQSFPLYSPSGGLEKPQRFFASDSFACIVRAVFTKCLDVARSDRIIVFRQPSDEGRWSKLLDPG